MEWTGRGKTNQPLTLVGKRRTVDNRSTAVIMIYRMSQRTRNAALCLRSSHERRRADYIRQGTARLVVVGNAIIDRLEKRHLSVKTDTTISDRMSHGKSRHGRLVSYIIIIIIKGLIITDDSKLGEFVSNGTL